MRVSVLTVSTRCSNGTATDESGPTLVEMIKSKGWSVAHTLLVKDDQLEIEKTLVSMATDSDVILTTGGTGLSPDDRTPEATKSVIDRSLPNLSMAMFYDSLQETRFAMLSRAECGVRDKCIIVNMPGSVKAVKTCFTSVAPVLEHAIALLNNRKNEVNNVHSSFGGGCRHHTHQQHIHNIPGNKEIRRVHGEQRPRESPYEAISVKEAIEIVLDHCNSSEVEPVKLSNVLTSTKRLAHDVYSKRKVPNFRASVKDGYAVISSDGSGTRSVIGRSDAGSNYVGDILLSGFAVAINTGAKVPDQADAVVQIEDTEFVSGKSSDGKILEVIKILKAPSKGQDIRTVGCDLQEGVLLAKRGEKITPSLLALLMSAGHSEVEAYKVPKIAVFSTGSELVNVESSQTDGYVVDTNRFVVLQLYIM